MIPPKALYIEAILSDKSIPMPMLFWYLKSLYRAVKTQDLDHSFWGPAIDHLQNSDQATCDFYYRLWKERLIKTIEEKVKALDGGTKMMTQVHHIVGKVFSGPVHQLSDWSIISVPLIKIGIGDFKVAIHESDAEACIGRRVLGTYAAVCMDDGYEDILPFGSYMPVKVMEKEGGDRVIRVYMPHPNDQRSTVGFGVLADIHPAIATSTLYYEYCTRGAKDLVEQFFQIYPVQVSISDNPPMSILYDTFFSDGPENPIAEWVRRGLMLFMQSSLPGPKTPLDFYKFMVSSWA